MPSDLSTCAAVAEQLPAVLGTPGGAPAELAEHLEHCLSCQAELARYRRLLRMLAQLRPDRVELAPGALSELLEVVEGAAKRRAIRSALAGHRVAYGGGLLAAAFAGACLVVLGRVRSARRPASA
ncbi:MAG: hypothetical protein JWM85_1037 [Acidimicrobiaceae bacterium]|nr:hypothetical protein [Acidimicrobiaceae bacterium]